MRQLWLTILATIMFALAAQGEPLFDVKLLSTSASLKETRATITADRAAISVEIPNVSGKPFVFDLDGKGKDPEYYWSLYTIGNSGSEARDIVVLIPRRGFSGSGLFRPEHTGSMILNARSSPPPAELTSVRDADEDVFPIRLQPGANITLAFEGIEPLADATIWTLAEYNKHQLNDMGLRGALAGVAILLAAGIILLTLIRKERIAYLVSAFALSSMFFVLHELGLFSLLPASIMPQLIGYDTSRAWVETLMTMGLVAALAGFSSTSRAATPFYFYGAVAAIFLLLCNLFLGWFQPTTAIGLARIAFAFVVLEGLLMLVTAHMKNQLYVINALPAWIGGVVWLAVVIFASLQASPHKGLDIAVLVLLCALVAGWGFVLLQSLFEQSDSAFYQATSSEDRNSFALTSGKHFLWEWRTSSDQIDTGSELATALGYRNANPFEGPQHQFFEHVHPDDMPVFIEKAGDVTAGTVRRLEHDFRLRNAEGVFQWFSLRARAQPDQQSGELVCLGTLTDITKAKQREERLQVDAVHDPVTGLPSRALFMDRLERSLKNRAGAPVRILVLDLDRFKTFNDGYGPDIGDQFLLITSTRIQAFLGNEDSATRLTGSQFAIAFSEAGAAFNEAAFADHIIKALTQPIVISDRQIVLSVSAGMSMRGLPGVAPDELMAQATSALHSSKLQGLGTFTVYDYGMRNDRIAQVALEADLRQAIARAEIEVHFQRIVTLQDGRTAGFEALARWRHPQLGLIAPEQFIGAAEEAGLIGDVGTLVLTEAARQLGIWQRTIARDQEFFVAVNVSASQLLDRSFLPSIQHIMNRETLLPQSLKIEVTEAVVMRYQDKIASLFEVLRSLGISLACDDFGTGFSSLSTLRSLPFDTLKLDRSFLTSEQDDDRAAHVIRSVLDLAHGLGMTVVCEGIESQEQADRLAEMGCDFGQGYHFGYAAPAREVEQLLEGAHSLFNRAPQLELQHDLLPFNALPGAVLDDVEPEELPSLFSVAQAQSTEKINKSKRKRKSTKKTKTGRKKRTTLT